MTPLSIIVHQDLTKKHNEVELATEILTHQKKID